MPTVKDTLEAGSTAPAFRLPSSTDGEVFLENCLTAGGAVLYFIREFGCMSCQFHAAALVKAYPDIKDRGFEVLVIGGGERSDAVKMAARLRAPFPILADRDRRVYDLYDVDKALMFIQRSATFVIDKRRRIVYAHRSTNPSGGLNLTEVLGAVEAASTAGVNRV